MTKTAILFNTVPQSSSNYDTVKCWSLHLKNHSFWINVTEIHFQMTFQLFQEEEGNFKSQNLPLYTALRIHFLKIQITKNYTSSKRKYIGI
jgi:hypothetical protein